MVTETRGSTSVGRKNRRDLYLIIGMFVFVLAASTTLYKIAESGLIDMPDLLGTRNNGILVTPPQAIDNLELRHGDGTAFDFASEDGSWTILVPVAGSCEEACVRSLYLTRQVRTALGKAMDRVQRLAVAVGAPDAELARLLEQEHPGVDLLTTSQTAFDRTFDEVEPTLQPLAGDRFFLVDPDGWLMMYYTSAHDGHALLEDMKFLLKYSPERGEE